MKVLAIRIRNLASLEGESIIDFTEEPLCSAGIFAITGPTGAGKSTILDALCLALYDETPRYKGADSTVALLDVKGEMIKQNDVKNILRDGASEGYAKVDFVGVDQGKYRATWSVRRSYNKADGALQPSSISIGNISSNTPIGGTKTELLTKIERLVGLSFEQFTRSVLLAQGDFTAFLKAGRDEKSSLLEKLTGTHIYTEISKKIYERWKAEDLTLQVLSKQRENIPTLTSEELEVYTNRKEVLLNLMKDCEIQIEMLGKEIMWHNQLHALVTNLQEAETAMSHANEEKKKASLREEKLKLIGEVQATRVWVEGLKNASDQVASKEEDLKRLDDQLKDLQNRGNSLEKLLTEANFELENRTKAQSEARPLLDKAKALDVQLKGKEDQVDKAKSDFETEEYGYKTQKQLLDQNLQKANLQSKEIEELSKWKDGNNNRQPIAENEKLILSKLTDASELLVALNSLEIEKVSTQKLLDKETQEREVLKENLSNEEHGLSKERESYLLLESEVTQISIGDLEQAKAQSDAFLEDVIKAQAHWTLLYKTLKEVEALGFSIQNTNNALVTKNEELKEKEEQLKVSQIRLATSKDFLEKARLATAESVEALRSKLVPNEPCLVCGSVDHPYLVHDPKQQYVLSELEAQHREIERENHDLVREESKLEELCKQLAATLKTNEWELVTKRTFLKEQEDQWKKFEIHKHITVKPQEQIKEWLEQQFNGAKEQQSRLQNQIQFYYKKKTQLEAQSIKIGQLEKQVGQITETIKDKDRILKTLQERIDQSLKDQEKQKSQLQELKKALFPYFLSNDWFPNWEKDSSGFEQKITAFAVQWKVNTEKLQGLVREQEVLSATIQGLKENVKRRSEAVQEKGKLLSEQQSQYDTLLKERLSIFNGKTAIEIEAQLQSAVESATQNLNSRKEEQQNLLREITKITTQKDQGGTDLDALKNQRVSFQEKINQWIDSYNHQKSSNLTQEQLIQLLTFTHDWMEEERKALRSIDNALTTAKSVFDERNATLEKHKQAKLSERDLEETKSLEETAKVTQAQLSKENNEIDFKLQQDSENRRKTGDLLKTIETKAIVVDNWAKLNDIIGSSDGKKFRQIAQEYTLDVLLGYANVHLEMLSKRYVLERIPNSLGLQVVDQDMGDEIRTVFSLSGGESFLVSLALALGLASLSSNRMKVESLFIDEGFGSLDPNTLNIAMDALERLQNQGRKVGVISHVQEMTERIPVQIKVSKMSSGRSNIDVLG